MPDRTLATVLVTAVSLQGALLSAAIGAGDAGWGFAAGLCATAVPYPAFTAGAAWYAAAPR